jgi:hypothetical protein
MHETLSTKKSLVFIIAGAVVLIGGLLVYGIMVTPARQPYRDALAQYKNVDQALARTNIAFNTSTATNEQFQKSVDVAQKAFTSLATENDALGKKDVLKEGEGKHLYDVYAQKIRGYIAYNKDVVASMVTVRPVLVKCSTAMNTATENAAGAEVLRVCETEMRSASNVPDADYKLLAESFAQNYAHLAAVFETIDRLGDPKGADAGRVAELTQERDTIVKDFETAGKTFSSDLAQHRQEILTTDAAKKLHDYLSDKSRIF